MTTGSNFDVFDDKKVAGVRLISQQLYWINIFDTLFLIWTCKKQIKQKKSNSDL